MQTRTIYRCWDVPIHLIKKMYNMEKIDALKLLFVNHYRIPIDETFEEDVTIKGFRFTYKKEELFALHLEEKEKLASEILGQLTEEEKAVFKRGRNAKSHAPRSASVAEYRMSTGFEALLGYLYLTEQHERLCQLAETAFALISKAMMAHVQETKGE